MMLYRVPCESLMFFKNYFIPLSIQKLVHQNFYFASFFMHINLNKKISVNTNIQKNKSAHHKENVSNEKLQNVMVVMPWAKFNESKLPIATPV